MNKKRVTGLFLISLSLFIFLTNLKITGAVVGSTLTNFVSILGTLFFVVGIFLFLQSGILARNYYSRRVSELFDPKYNHQDAWITRSEIEGVIDEIKQNYQKVDIEHGNNTPTIHFIGGKGVPKQRNHLDVKVKDSSRHLLITEDPYDPRLKLIGVISEYNSQKGKRVESRVYTPDHPRELNSINKTYIETVSPSEKKKVA